MTTSDQVIHELDNVSGYLTSCESVPGFDLDALGVDFSDGVDLKAISKRASQIAEKRVIDKVLQQTRWNRKEAALRLQISYKALLYKMKENGLSEGR